MRKRVKVDDIVEVSFPWWFLSIMWTVIEERQYNIRCNFITIARIKLRNILPEKLDMVAGLFLVCFKSLFSHDIFMFYLSFGHIVRKILILYLPQYKAYIHINWNIVKTISLTMTIIFSVGAETSREICTSLN